jgi:hypothetical protein
VQEDLVNASFGFGNIADSRPPPELMWANMYNTILAIESLSYASERNLKNLLAVMHRSLRKGGIVVLVDDVVLPKDPSERGYENADLKVQIFRAALMRPAILTHDQWMRLFKEAGFQVVEARDLTLEFDLLPDALDTSLPNEGAILFSVTLIRIWRYLEDLYLVVTLESLKFLVNMLDSTKQEEDSVWGPKFSAWLRMHVFQHGVTAGQRVGALRKGAYENADFGYNFYVLKR